MPRVAIFGDSYVSRLSRYCGGDLKVPSEVNFFGKGGMKAASVPSDMLSQVFDFRPDLVVLNLGGNDIRPVSSPKTIFNRLFHLVEQFQQHGVKTVYVCELAERGCFSKCPGNNKKVI